MENKILTELPMTYGIGRNKSKLCVDIKSIIGMNIEIYYKNNTYIIYVINYNKKTRKIIFLYNNEEFELDRNMFINCNFGRIFKYYTKEFKIEIGVILKDNKRDITIIDREYRVDKNGKTLKWYKYHCNKDNYEGWMVESSLFFGCGCSVCCSASKTVVKGINDIATTHPHLIKYFKNIKDAYKYSFGSGKKVWLICPDCGFEKLCTICSFISQNFSCEQCGDGISYPNKFMFNILEQLNINFTTEYSPKWCKYEFKNRIKQGSYDFYIPSMNLIVEMDGGWHNNDNTISKQTTEESINIDNIKDSLANQHDIEVIRINCDYKDICLRFEYIKDSILNSKLNELFGLNIVDWISCERYSYKNIMLEVCEYWNKKKEYETSNSLTKYFPLRKVTIQKYLKQGSKIGLCNYNPKNEMIKNGKNNGKANGKQIEIFKDGISLGVFESAPELERQSEKLFGVKLNSKNISAVCNGKRNHHKGFTFSFTT